MSEESNGSANIENFLNKHLVKVFYGVIVYFLTTLSSDFKDVKVTLQTILINQATMEQRVSNVEARAKQNSDDIKDLRVYHQNGK